MRSKTAQEKGYDFEKEFGAALGVKPTKGSGNQWFAKMDLGDSSILVSCKHTDAESFRLTAAHMREVQAACVGEQEPVEAISVRGEVYVVQRLGDWLAARSKPAEAAFIKPGKSAVKRATAKVPALLRQTEDEE